ncbi:MAG: phosphohistidine phosphatase [Kiritimatiellia bacterium]|jgi:phosphohistidine phosphatase
MPVRRLIIMRHAKSSWQHDLEDHQRPLNQRGRRAAPVIAAHLAQLGWRPEIVICSDSARTTETWRCMQEAFSPPCEVRFDHRLYLASVGTVRRVLAELPDETTTAMVLGHNPSSESYVEWLTGMPMQFTTANAALLQWRGVGWQQALTTPSGAELVALLRPKELA